jgi:hypothetical protein
MRNWKERKMWRKSAVRLVLLGGVLTLMGCQSDPPLSADLIRKNLDKQIERERRLAAITRVHLQAQIVPARAEEEFRKAFSSELRRAGIEVVATREQAEAQIIVKAEAGLRKSDDQGLKDALKNPKLTPPVKALLEKRAADYFANSYEFELFVGKDSKGMGSEFGNGSGHEPTAELAITWLGNYLGRKTRRLFHPYPTRTQTSCASRSSPILKRLASKLRISNERTSALTSSQMARDFPMVSRPITCIRTRTSIQVTRV